MFNLSHRHHLLENEIEECGLQDILMLSRLVLNGTRKTAPASASSSDDPSLVSQYLQDETKLLNTFFHQSVFLKKKEADVGSISAFPMAREGLSIETRSSELNPNLVNITSSVQDQFTTRANMLNLLIARAVLPEWYDEIKIKLGGGVTTEDKDRRQTYEQNAPDESVSPPSRVHLGGLSQAVILLDSTSSFAPHILYNVTSSFIKRRLKPHELRGRHFNPYKIASTVREALRHVHVVTPPDPRPEMVWSQVVSLWGHFVPDSGNLTKPGESDDFDSRVEDEMLTALEHGSIERSVWAVILDGWEEMAWSYWNALPSSSDNPGLEERFDQESFDRDQVHQCQHTLSSMANPPAVSSLLSSISLPSASSTVLDALVTLSCHLSCLTIVTSTSQSSSFEENSEDSEDIGGGTNAITIPAGLTVHLTSSRSAGGRLSPPHRAKWMPHPEFEITIEHFRPDSKWDARAWSGMRKGRRKRREGTAMGGLNSKDDDVWDHAGRRNTGAATSNNVYAVDYDGETGEFSILKQ